MSVSSWIRRQFKNGVSVTDTIPSGMSSGAMSFTAADGSTFPDGSVGSFIVTVDQGLSTEEKILCSARAGAVFTVASGGRGYNSGGTPQNHGAGATVFHTIDQQDLDEANQVAVATLGAIQASGDLLQGTGANALGRLARGAANTFLQVQGTSLGYVAYGSGGTANVASTAADGTSTAPARYDHAHAGVTSYNGRKGIVVATAADIEALFTADKQIFSGTGSGTGELIDLLAAMEEEFGAAGQLLVGTGAGTGELLPAGAAGTVLTVGGADASGLEWIYPALTSAAGHLTNDYAVTGSLVTYLTTASLVAGTWLITHNAHITPGTSAGIEIEALVGTATATFEGKASGEVSATATSGQFMEASLSFIATITVAGTLIFQAKNNGGAASFVKATTASNGLAKATGYTAIRIA